MFVLQLKDDIRTGKLDCPSGSDVELSALSMQGKRKRLAVRMNDSFICIGNILPAFFFSHFLAELGDHNRSEHTVETISEFRFLPDVRQTEDFEEQVLEKWSTYKCVRIRLIFFINEIPL